MRAISLWQPWAEAIKVGRKWIETRHWRPPHYVLGQRIAIHAAKRPIQVGERKAFGSSPDWVWLRDIDELDYGGIVATAFLKESKPTEYFVNLAEQTDASQYPYGNFSPGRFGWVLLDIRPTQFVAVKGRQGFFNVPDSKILEGGSK